MKATREIFELIDTNIQELSDLLINRTSASCRTSCMDMYNAVLIRYIRNIERESNI